MSPGMLEAAQPQSSRTETDAVAMREAFESFFAREYPGLGLSVASCEVCRVYQRPNKEVHVTYRVQGEDRRGQAYDQWLHGRISLQGGKFSSEGDDPRAANANADFWKPVSVWPERKMVLHAFPYDPKLPFLRKLVDAVWVKQRVEENLSGFGLSPDWKCRNVVCQKVKYMPGKRCVLRYRITLRQHAGEEYELHFYSKTADDAKGAYVFETLQAICSDPACRNGDLNIPAPIAFLPEARTLWQNAGEGIGLSKKAALVGWPSLLQPNLFARLANALAALHGVRLPEGRLKPGASASAMLQNAEGDVANIRQFFPEPPERLTLLLEKLARVKAELGSPAVATTIHGSFKIAQILCHEDKIALVDFDSVAHGDPLYDVAEFITSVLYLRISHDLPPATLEESVTLFLARYFEHVTWKREERRIGWYAAAFLLGKIHSSLKRGEIRAVANLDAALDLCETRLARNG